MAGLVNLKALHIIKFRNSDTCVWVMRETLRFMVDAIAHNPDLKLEWVALEYDRVERIVRKTKEHRSRKKAARKNKPENQSSLTSAAASGLWQSDSESEDEGVSVALDFASTIEFYGGKVKIFSRPIRSV